MVVTSVAVLLSLSFVLVATCQEVLGSCIFLFVKHPYDVGDQVVIRDTELIVKHIALLYTVFTRTDRAIETQTSNNVLNTLWVANVTRSRVIKESFRVRIAADTQSDRIESLKARMTSSSRAWESAYRTKISISLKVVEIVGLLAMELQCELVCDTIKGVDILKVRAGIQSDFKIAWISALCESGIRAPIDALAQLSPKP